MTFAGGRRASSVAAVSLFTREGVKNIESP
jgi:hypothetical protein